LDGLIKLLISDEKAREIAANLLAEGMSVDAIARITGLSLEVVQQLHPIAEEQE